MLIQYYMHSMVTISEEYNSAVSTQLVRHFEWRVRTQITSDVRLYGLSVSNSIWNVIVYRSALHEHQSRPVELSMAEEATGGTITLTTRLPLVLYLLFASPYQ